MEIQFLNWLQTLHNPWLDSFMIGVTNLGNKGAIWIIITAGLLIYPKTRRTGIVVLISLAAEFIFCNLMLKPLIARPRPFEANPGISLLIAPPEGFSFPSGHAGDSFAAASALFFQKSRLRIPAVITAVLIAFSRLYLYVHYPSDVLAGALIGMATGWLSSFRKEIVSK